jgi:hypothetical protein
VITREQAERIAAEILRYSPATERGWELIEFDSGWLIKEEAANDPDYLGAAVRVVERASGRVMRFPSSVPPDRILEDYDEVIPRGKVEKEGSDGRGR